METQQECDQPEWKDHLTPRQRRELERMMERHLDNGRAAYHSGQRLGLCTWPHHAGSANDQCETDPAA